MAGSVAFRAREYCSTGVDTAQVRVCVRGGWVSWHGERTRMGRIYGFERVAASAMGVGLIVLGIIFSLVWPVFFGAAQPLAAADAANAGVNGRGVW